MEVIIRPRQSGKTTDLIRRSAETKEVIVVPFERDVALLRDKAEDHGLRIPQPISWTAFSARRYSVAVPGLLIDDLDFCLDAMSQGLVRVGTFSGPTPQPTRRMRVVWVDEAGRVYDRPDGT